MAPNRVQFQAGDAFITAEKQSNGTWTFVEKCTGDARAYPRKSTPLLVARAEVALKQKRTQGKLPV